MDKKGQNEQNRKIWTNLDRWTVKDKMKNKDNFTKMRHNGLKGIKIVKWQNKKSDVLKRDDKIARGKKKAMILELWTWSP